MIQMCFQYGNLMYVKITLTNVKLYQLKKRKKFKKLR